MDIKFSCKNKNCNYKGSGEYVMCIPSEAVADVNNMAAVFCPHCGKELCKPESLKPEPCKPVEAAQG